VVPVRSFDSRVSSALALLVIAVVGGLGWLLFGGRRTAELGAAATGACDARLRFEPDPPGAGRSLSLRYAHGEPLKYVDLKVTGPVYPGARLEDVGVAERSDFTWIVTALEPGEYRFEVWGGAPSTPVATCIKRVAAD
jgi:hypothetical protein